LIPAQTEKNSQNQMKDYHKYCCSQTLWRTETRQSAQNNESTDYCQDKKNRTSARFSVRSWWLNNRRCRLVCRRCHLTSDVNVISFSGANKFVINGVHTEDFAYEV